MGSRQLRPASFPGRTRRIATRTVCSLMTGAPAISRLDFPSASRRRTSNSRTLSPPTVVGASFRECSSPRSRPRTPRSSPCGPVPPGIHAQNPGRRSSHSAKVRMGIWAFRMDPGLVPDRPRTCSRRRSGARRRSMVAAEAARSFERTSGATSSSPARSIDSTISVMNGARRCRWGRRASPTPDAAARGPGGLTPAPVACAASRGAPAAAAASALLGWRRVHPVGHTARRASVPSRASRTACSASPSASSVPIAPPSTDPPHPSSGTCGSQGRVPSTWTSRVRFRRGFEDISCESTRPLARVCAKYETGQQEAVA